MKPLKYLVKFCGKIPKTLWDFKVVLVLHGLHTTHVFPFQPKLIFLVKIKAIKMFRHCPVKDQNCWESVSLWGHSALRDSSWNARKLMLQFRWVAMSWTLLNNLSVLNCNKNEHKGTFIQSCAAFLTFLVFCHLTHSKDYLLIDIHRYPPLLHVLTCLFPCWDNHPFCPVKFGFHFILQ